jgi:beta-lactamase class D
MKDLFHREWYCQVFHSGFHNGCYCSEQEPHFGWDCGYRWIAGTFKDTEGNRNFIEKVNWFTEEITEKVNTGT